MPIRNRLSHVDPHPCGTGPRRFPRPGACMPDPGAAGWRNSSPRPPLGQCFYGCLGGSVEQVSFLGGGSDRGSNRARSSCTIVASGEPRLPSAETRGPTTQEVEASAENARRMPRVIPMGVHRYRSHAGANAVRTGGRSMRWGRDPRNWPGDRIKASPAEVPASSLDGVVVPRGARFALKRECSTRFGTRSPRCTTRGDGVPVAMAEWAMRGGHQGLRQAREAWMRCVTGIRSCVTGR